MEVMIQLNNIPSTTQVKLVQDIRQFGCPLLFARLWYQNSCTPTHMSQSSYTTIHFNAYRINENFGLPNERGTVLTIKHPAKKGIPNSTHHNRMKANFRIKKQLHYNRYPSPKSLVTLGHWWPSLPTQSCSPIGVSAFFLFHLFHDSITRQFTQLNLSK